jgi:large subunit ribosomal protein L10
LVDFFIFKIKTKQMALTKAEKKEMMQGVETAVKGAKSVVFVNFKGLTVADTVTMRRDLRANNVGYLVAKKTITRKALDAGAFKGAMPEMPGELAIAYSEDLTASAREILAASKKHDKKITIQGGIFDGEYKNKEEMLAIALIPSKQVLYGMFVNIINSPIQRFAIVIDQIAKTKTV